MASKLILLTDTHITAQQRLLMGLNPVERLRCAIDHALQHHADAAFAILTGDLADAGEPAAYQDLAFELKRLPFPVHLAIGNHDDRDHFNAVFEDDLQTDRQASFVQYTFQSGGVCHIVLDTVEPYHSHGVLCAQRQEWLKKTLMLNREQPCMVYMHHPPYDSGIKEMDECRLMNADDLAKVLLPHRNRILQIFHGHLHRDVHTVFAGIPVCGSRSTVHTIALQTQNNQTLAVSNEPPGYTVALFDEQTALIHHQGFLQGNALTLLS